MPTEYFVREVKETSHQTEFEIAKFTDGSRWPNDVYIVTRTHSNDYFHCNCMGFRQVNSQKHKHIVMAKSLIALGYNFFDEELHGQKVF